MVERGERCLRGGGSPARVPEPLRAGGWGGLGAVCDRSLFPCPKSLLFLFGGGTGLETDGAVWDFAHVRSQAAAGWGWGEAWRRSD